MASVDVWLRKFTSKFTSGVYHVNVDKVPSDKKMSSF